MTTQAKLYEYVVWIDDGRQFTVRAHEIRESANYSKGYEFVRDGTVVAIATSVAAWRADELRSN